jgi:hypothetical protein
MTRKCAALIYHGDGLLGYLDACAFGRSKYAERTPSS